MPSFEGAYLIVFDVIVTREKDVWLAALSAASHNTWAIFRLRTYVLD